MSLFLRFLACAFIVAATSIVAAFAWDQSDAATPDSPGSTANPRAEQGPLPPSR